MDTAIAVALIGLIEAVGVVIIGGLFNRNNKKNAEYREFREAKEREEANAARERDHDRKELEASMYDLNFAVANATEVLLKKAHGDQLNGDVEAALKAISEAKSESNRLLSHNAMNR